MTDGKKVAAKASVAPEATGPGPETERVGTKVNPLLSRRMVNAHARLSGCGEYSPDMNCEHRIASRRVLEQLLVRYEAEQP